jgi:hypothetical protein
MPGFALCYVYSAFACSADMEILFLNVAARSVALIISLLLSHSDKQNHEGRCRNSIAAGILAKQSGKMPINIAQSTRHHVCVPTNAFGVGCKRS